MSIMFELLPHWLTTAPVCSSMATLLPFLTATETSKPLGPVWSKNSNERGCLGKSRFHAVRSDGGQYNRRHGRSLSPTRKQAISWKDFIRSHMGVLVGTCLTARPMDKCRLSRKCNANCRRRRQKCGKRQQMKEKVVCENLPQLADFVRLATPLARFGKVDRTATNQKVGSSNPPGRTILLSSFQSLRSRFQLKFGRLLWVHWVQQRRLESEAQSQCPPFLLLLCGTSRLP